MIDAKVAQRAGGNTHFVELDDIALRQGGAIRWSGDDFIRVSETLRYRMCSIPVRPCRHRPSIRG